MNMRRFLVIFIGTLALLGSSTFLMWHRDSGPIPEEASHAWAQAPSSTIELIPGGGAVPSGNAGGSLAGSYPNPTIAADTVGASQLTSTTVTPATYGSATTSPVLIIDADGRVTGASNTTITATPPGGIAGGDLTGTFPDPTITTNALGSAEVIDNSLTGADIDESSLVLTGLIGTAAVVDNSLTGTDINESTLLLTGLIGPGELASTTVTPGTYGTATSAPTLTVDADGRVTTATQTAIVLDSAGVVDNSLTTSDILDNTLTGTDITESTLVLTNLISTAEVVDNSLTGSDITESTLVLTNLIGPGELSSTAVTPGTYGTATTVPVVTIDADGRITEVTSATITTGGGGSGPPTGTAGGGLTGTYPDPTIATDAIGSAAIIDNAVTGTDINESTLVLTGLIGPGELASTAVTPGAYGSASSTGTFTVDADGRVTLAATVPIAIPISAVTEFDLVTTPPSSGDVLLWDTSTGKFVPRPNSASVATPGIMSTAAGVEAIHYNTITLTNTCGLLGTISHVNITGAAAGVPCVLPDPTSVTDPTFYSLYLIDESLVTLSPSGTTLLNGFNAPMAPIRGPRARFKVEWRNEAGWFATMIASVGYGEPITSVHTSVGGSTNTSSSGSGTWHTHSQVCLLPAGAITLGTTLDICVGTRLVTGSAPPALLTQFVANNTPIWRSSTSSTAAANIPGHTRRHCITVMGGAVPSASSALYTAANGDAVGNLSSIIGDPVLVDTTVALTLSYQTQWVTAETGTNSLEQMYLDVKGARFAN